MFRDVQGRCSGFFRHKLPPLRKDSRRVMPRRISLSVARILSALPPPQSYCQTWSRTPRSQNSSLQGHWRQTRQTLPILVARAIRHLRGKWVLARSDRLWGQALAHSSLEDNSWWNPAEADKTWAQAAIRESKFQRTGNLCDLKHDLNRFKSIWFLSHLATPLFLSLEFAHIKKKNVNHASELVPSLRYDTIP